MPGMEVWISKELPSALRSTIFAEKPGIVIGKGGKLVRQLTQDLATDFGVESPQIDVQQVANPSYNAQIMAERLANALERGWYFRKAGSSIIRRVMESGALGCEVIIAGKLTRSTGEDPEVYRRVRQTFRRTGQHHC